MTDFNARDFFDLGLKIAEAYDNESGYRTAIGRVYYACHLIGRDATLQKGWFRPKYKGEDHSGLCKILKEHDPKIVGPKMRDLLEMREHADYHIKKCRDEDCSYCQSVENGLSLVTQQLWERAKSIASDILPKLEKIYPSKPEGKSSS